MDQTKFGLLAGGLTTVLVVGVTCVATLGGLAFTGAILWFTLRPLMQNAQQRTAILQSGIPATATVLSLTSTGMMVNYNPQVKIVLQVNPPNGVPYQTDTTLVISQLQIPQVQPGAILPVKIDPKDPAKVALAI